MQVCSGCWNVAVRNCEAYSIVLLHLQCCNEGKSALLCTKKGYAFDCTLAAVNFGISSHSQATISSVIYLVKC